MDKIIRFIKHLITQVISQPHVSQKALMIIL